MRRAAQQFLYKLAPCYLCRGVGAAVLLAGLFYVALAAESLQVRRIVRVAAPVSVGMIAFQPPGGPAAQDAAEGIAAEYRPADPRPSSGVQPGVAAAHPANA